MAYLNLEGAKVFYTAKGSGFPLVFLHGNSASGKMYANIRKHYTQDFKVITFDFPGHGKSSRLKEFPTDFWYENAKVATKFIEALGFDKVNLVGSSGGAIVALNIGLEAPALVNKIVADSFPGEYVNVEMINQLEEERDLAKNNLIKRMFWFVNHGNDWRKIVDLDTEMNIRFAKESGMYFHKKLSELCVPVLFTGSKQDESITNLEEIYLAMQENVSNSQVAIFEKGKHPAILTRARDISNTIKTFLKNE